jgi:menaquinone-dependent protoporphyrinogen oxidase
VVVGSGMKIGKWTAEPEKFLKKFQKELSKKKVAIFVSSASQAILEHEGKTEEIEKARREYLEEKAAKYSLHPIAMGVLGGVWDYNKMGFFFKKTMSAFKQVIEAAGFKETEPEVYDTRDWDVIRSWAKEIAQKARE